MIAGSQTSNAHIKRGAKPGFKDRLGTVQCHMRKQPRLGKSWINQKPIRPRPLSARQHTLSVRCMRNTSPSGTTPFRYRDRLFRHLERRFRKPRKFGHVQPEWPVTFLRNQWSRCPGIPTIADGQRERNETGRNSEVRATRQKCFRCQPGLETRPRRKNYSHAAPQMCSSP